jgi:hypothetical protein
MISMPVVHSSQTMHLSCAEINTISTQTKSRFCSTHVTSVYYWVRPKWVSCLWYIRRKLCTYLASRLHYLQMDQNKLPLDPHHLGVPSGASKWFRSLWYVRRKPCTYLASRLTLSPNRLKWASTWPMLPKRTLGECPNRFQRLWYIRRKPCSYLTLRKTLSPNRPKQDSPWPTSPRSTIGCAQNDFHGRCTFGVNHAPILCWD